jgi:hypothetical protein
MEQELTAHTNDGHIVRVTEVAPPVPLPDPLPRYAIEHGERLVRDPDDIDHTLFLSALTLPARKCGCCEGRAAAAPIEAGSSASRRFRLTTAVESTPMHPLIGRAAPIDAHCGGPRRAYRVSMGPGTYSDNERTHSSGTWAVVAIVAAIVAVSLFL